MSMLQEFKTFAMRGNVVDLAVGVVIGGAFGKIVSSLVGDLLMPILGVLIGDVDFSKLAITLREATDKDHPAVLFAYGKFLQASLDFVIIAFAIFLLVKGINSLKRKEETAAPAAPPPPPPTEVLLTEIRDLLKAK